jgi:hypothetical protein
MKSGKLNFLECSGPLQACNGTALPSYFNTVSVKVRNLFRSLGGRVQELDLWTWSCIFWCRKQRNSSSGERLLKFQALLCQGCIWIWIWIGHTYLTGTRALCLRRMRPELEARHPTLACAVIKKMGELLARLSSAVRDSNAKFYFFSTSHIYKSSSSLFGLYLSRFYSRIECYLLLYLYK